MASPHEPNNSVNNSAASNATSLHRPTEGQLRWAQFHHKRNAEFVQQRVERLWLHPVSVSDVPGALPGDGDEENESSIDRKHSSSTLSSGRRALLKVSQRQFEKRKEHIAEHGFIWNTIDDMEEDGTVATGSLVSSASLVIRAQEDDALAEIFAGEHFRNNKRQRRQKKKILSEKDRVRRFEAAFYALLHALKKHQDSQQTKILATKRWERPGATNDGNFTHFQVPKLSATHQVSMRNSDKMSWMTTPDRSASWLVHLPSKAATASTTTRNYHQHRNGNISDETREQLTLVALQYLNQSSSGDNTNADDDGDVATLVDELLERHVTDENSVKNLLARFESPSSTFLPSSQPALTDTAAPATTMVERVQQFEVQQQQNDDNNKSFVKQFVEQIEAACRKEKWVTADGKLHKQTFARLLERYLEQCQRSKGNNSNPDSTNTIPQSSAVLVVRTILDQLERGILHVDTMVSAEGKLNTSALEEVVERYLDLASAKASAAASPEGIVSDPTAVLHALTISPKLTVTDTTTSQQQTTATRTTTPATSNFFRRVRNVREKVNQYRLGAVAGGGAVSEASTTVEDKVESAVQEAITPSAEQADAARLNDSQSTAISNKVVELFHSLQHQQVRLDTTEPEQAGLKEYSAFRQAQNQRNSNKPDDGSSLSSFRVLPAGLRRVVERVRGGGAASQLSPRDELAGRGHELDDDDTGSEHKRMDSLDDACSTEEHLDKSLGETESRYLSSSQGRLDNGSSVYSSENIKDLQSALIRGLRAEEQGVIDTDRNSDGTGAGMPVDMVASLMLSPTILTKRHQQAIRAVENRKWDQVMYLLSANPWLAEMADLTTNQYILHKLAFFGAGDPDGSHAAPEKLNVDCVRMFPSAVHKFDKDGDLPLHMATASANAAMIKLVGDRFPSGASVRNEDGMLPLHLAILAFASQAISPFNEELGHDIVKRLISYFPGSLAVVDNEGNLPIHTAATVLTGQIGASLVYLLVDEAEKQISGPAELRFRTKRTTDEIENMSSVSTEATDSPTDSSDQSDDTTNCLLVRNELHDTPLAAAIYSGAGWEVIEALTCKDAALQPLDADANNALHLLVSEEHKDPAAALAILKLVPEVATMRNGSGMLPIEIACMQCPVRELILALVLVDLPIDLDRPNDTQVRAEFGASWWYIACECDDFYSDIVGEVVSMCSYSQVEALSMWTNKSQGSLFERATPKSRAILSSILRFAGRFEIVGSGPSYENFELGIEEYHALDYGPFDDPLVDGRRVLLRCFTSESTFRNETAVLHDLTVDPSSFEDIVPFTIDALNQQSRFPRNACQRFFIAIERPDLTLSGVVRGMLCHSDCQNDMKVRQRYTMKVLSVLRRMAKCLRRLHGQGYVHGDICLENCGTFEGEWKLSDILGAQRIGLPIEKDRLSSSAPPEAVREQSGVAIFRSDLVAHPSLDSWAFGRLAYEVIVGDALIEFDVSLAVEADHASLGNLCNWSQSNVQHACQALGRLGVADAAISMVAECLSPNADSRPSMDGILTNPVWAAFRR